MSNFSQAMPIDDVKIKFGDETMLLEGVVSWVRILLEQYWIDSQKLFP